MKIIWRSLLILLGLILFLILLGFMYLKLSPRMGGDPSGDRLAMLQASPHYQNGKFQNRIETNMDIPLGVMAGVIWESLTGGSDRIPKAPLPTVPFDREAWMQLPDTGYAVAWFGHSSLLIKLKGITFLCDPVFSERASAFTFIGPKRFPYTHHHRLAELPPIDAVLLSHDHYDHLDYDSVLELKDSVPLWLMPLGVGAHLERWGVPAERIREYDLWENAQIGTVELTLVPTRHFSGRGITNRFSTLWGGWVMQSGGERLLFGGDSGHSPTFREIGQKFGPFDLVLLECGAYNENWSSIHMMPEQVAQAAMELKAQVLMPIHWAKFDLALHPWKEPIERLGNAMTHSDVRLLTPRIGSISTGSHPSASSEWWSGLP